MILTLLGCVSPTLHDLRGDGWREVSLWGTAACFVHEDGDGACWADPGAWARGATFGSAEAVATQDQGVCSLWDGLITCDALNEESGWNGPYTLLAAGAEHVCGVLEGGTPTCADGPEAPDFAPRTALAIDVESTVCVILNDGSLSCWGFELMFSRTQDVPLEEVHVTGTTVCVRDEDDTLWCGSTDWITGDLVETASDLVAFDVHDEGSTAYYCGITTNGTLECGYLPFDRVGIDDPRTVVSDVPTDNTFQALSVGSARACALTDDGHIVCWGEVDSW